MSTEHNKVFVVSGPKEGVGKTAIALNLGTNYAVMNNKETIIVELDPYCRKEMIQYFSGSSSETVYHLFSLIKRQKMEDIDPQILRGRIPLNAQKVGAISLANKREELEGFSPELIIKTLAVLSGIYTLVIDIEENYSEVQIPLFDLADLVFWVFLPFAPSLRQTYKKLEELKILNFSLDKFVLVLNQSDLPESLSLKEINNALTPMGKTVFNAIPYEKALYRSLNSRQPLVLLQPRADFSQVIRNIIEGVSRHREVRQKSSVGILKEFLSRSDQAVDSFDLSQSEASTRRDQIKRGGIISRQQESDEKRNQLKQKIHRQLIEEMNLQKIDLNQLSDEAQKEDIHRTVEKTVSIILSNQMDVQLSRNERQELVNEIVDEALGLGAIEDLLKNPEITEIMVNRKDQIYIEKKGKLTQAPKKFMSDEQIVQVIRRIIAPLGRRIDESVPLVDARLKDGSRVNAIIPPLAVQGPTLTIRRFPERALSADDLINLGALTHEMVKFLQACVVCRKNIIVSGGTGSGKTTLLNMLSSFIPDDERIITVEDVAELRLQKAHLVRLESRPPNIEGKGEITIRDLVRNTLRMRPDRIIVGECRGAEALDMLQAMNTGHEGSLTTVHANTPRDMLSRLEAMVLMTGAELPVSVIRSYISAAIHVIIQVARLQDGSRKVVQISEVTGRQGDVITTLDLFAFRQTGVEDGQVMGFHEPTGAIPKFFEEFKSRGIGIDINIFKKDRKEVIGSG